MGNPIARHDEGVLGLGETPYRSASMHDAVTGVSRLLSTAGRLIVFVITVTSSVLSFIAFGLTWRTLAVLVVVAIVVTSVATNVYLLMGGFRRRRSQVRHLAYLIPSSGGHSFYGHMFNHLARHAALALHQNYVIVPVMPTESFETVSIWSLFASLEDRQLEIEGIFFIPDDPDAHFEELVGFHESHGDIPLILLDVFFDLDACDARTRGRLPSFVGGDEAVGGAIAADVIGELLQNGCEKPQVLVVNGTPTAWENQRAAAFRERMLERFPQTEFIETRPINWAREDAFAVVCDLLSRRADPSGAISLDAVFACNDDMAIGTRRALVELERGGYRFSTTPQICGYDGLGEIREYLASSDRFIAGTVDVRLEEQAKAAMLEMHGALRSGKRVGRVQLIEPVPLLRVHPETATVGDNVV